jgi:hypothetical protein
MRSPPQNADAVAHAQFFNPTVSIWDDPRGRRRRRPIVSRLVANAWCATARPCS